MPSSADVEGTGIIILWFPARDCWNTPLIPVCLQMAHTLLALGSLGLGRTFFSLVPQLHHHHNVTWLQAEIAKRTFHTLSQRKLAWQVGTWGDTEGILFCGFRLHKHHYHLPDLELLCCSAATPILSGTLNGDARSLSGTRAIESTKKGFFSPLEFSVWCGGMCVRERVRIYVRALTQ